MKENAGKCVHCKFFEQRDKAFELNDGRTLVDGFCKRFPPRAVEGDIRGHFKINIYPIMSGSDWCGEFQEQLRTAKAICNNGYLHGEDR